MAGFQNPRPLRLAESHLVEQLGAVAAVINGVQRQELVERRAQRIDVGAVVDDPAAGAADCSGLM